MAQLYSTDEILRNLTVGCDTGEISGYIVDISEIQTAGSRMFRKFIVTNGNIKMTCIMWGIDVIQRYDQHIVLNNIVNIERGCVKSVNTRYSNRDCSHDVVILDYSILTVLGIHAP